LKYVFRRYIIIKNKPSLMNPAGSALSILFSMIMIYFIIGLPQTDSFANISPAIKRPRPYKAGIADARYTNEKPDAWIRREESSFYPIIHKAADKHDVDPALIKAIIMAESRYNPMATSEKGAIGLMQIMPETGKHFGIDITSSPGDNIKAGAKYISWLHSIFDAKIPDEKERMRFILASYNAGPGHILDAMRLAEKNGMNPLIWEDNVAVWLQKKSEE